MARTNAGARPSRGRRVTWSPYARRARSEADMDRLLWRAIPPGFDGPIIDEFPGERIEAVYLVKASNTKHFRLLSQAEIDRLKLGDLFRAIVHEATTSPREIGEKGMTPTIFGQAVPKDRFFVLVKKHRKHGVFVPVTSRELQGLEGLGEAERYAYIGFRKEGEVFDRNKLTEKDPQYLAKWDPLMLAEGDLDPFSFANLSYPTSLYWSSNLLRAGCLTNLSTQRVLELFEEIDQVTPEQDLSSEMEELKDQENAFIFQLHESTASGEEDPDRPKGTANEQIAAYSARHRDVESVLKPLKEVEDKIFQAVDDSTINAAKAENNVRRKRFEYHNALQAGDIGTLALELYQKEIEEAKIDRDEKQKIKDDMVALAEEMERKPELRPRIPAGAEITEGRMTIINDAMRSLQDRMDSISKQM